MLSIAFIDQVHRAIVPNLSGINKPLVQLYTKSSKLAVHVHGSFGPERNLSIKFSPGSAILLL